MNSTTVIYTLVSVNTCNSYYNDLSMISPNVTHCLSLSSCNYYVITEDNELLMQLCCV